MAHLIKGVFAYFKHRLFENNEMNPPECAKVHTSHQSVSGLTKDGSKIFLRKLAEKFDQNISLGDLLSLSIFTFEAV